MNNIEELAHVEDLTWDNIEAEELRQFLGNEHLKRALAIIYQGMLEQQQGLIHYNLENPAERAEATKIQGKIQGVNEFLDSLMELAMQQTEQEQDNG